MEYTSVLVRSVSHSYVANGQWDQALQTEGEGQVMEYVVPQGGLFSIVLAPSI